ncbi:MAG: hypothetical protein WC797_01335, partial [Candidatus Paceibacterota bacterium]
MRFIISRSHGPVFDRGYGVVTVVHFMPGDRLAVLGEVNKSFEQFTDQSQSESVPGATILDFTGNCLTVLSKVTSNGTACNVAHFARENWNGPENRPQMFLAGDINQGKANRCVFPRLSKRIRASGTVEQQRQHSATGGSDFILKFAPEIAVSIAELPTENDVANNLPCYIIRRDEADCLLKGTQSPAGGNDRPMPVTASRPAAVQDDSVARDMVRFACRVMESSDATTEEKKAALSRLQ